MRCLLIMMTVLAGSLAWLAPAHASLISDQVNGTLNFLGFSANFFDPANNGQGFGVPPGFGNSAGLPATISATQTTFGYQDGSNTDTADFTATQLIFTDVSASGGTNVTSSFTLVTGGEFSSLSLVSSDIAGLTYSLSGGTITLAYPAFPSGGTFIATFDVGGATAIPEPGGLALIGSGLLGLGLVRRGVRRSRL
jgi:hypothetical protein